MQPDQNPAPSPTEYAVPPRDGEARRAAFHAFVAAEREGRSVNVALHDALAAYSDAAPSPDSGEREALEELRDFAESVEEDLADRIARAAPSRGREYRLGAQHAAANFFEAIARWIDERPAASSSPPAGGEGDGPPCTRCGGATYRETFDDAGDYRPGSPGWWWSCGDCGHDGPVVEYDGEVCRSCGGPVALTCPTYWTADDELWNAVEGGPGGIRCIPCFTRDAQAKGIHVSWRVVREPSTLASPGGEGQDTSSREDGRYSRNFREAMEDIHKLPPSERSAMSNRSVSPPRDTGDEGHAPREWTLTGHPRGGAIVIGHGPQIASEEVVPVCEVLSAPVFGMRELIKRALTSAPAIGALWRTVPEIEEATDNDMTPSEAEGLRTAIRAAVAAIPDELLLAAPAETREGAG